MSWTTTDFLEVSTRVLSKVATNGFLFNIFEAIILDQKWRSVNEVIHVFRLFSKEKKGEVTSKT